MRLYRFIQDNMRRNRPVDVQALILAVLSTILADAALALWYDIRASDLAKLGVFGLPLFFSMCGLAVGVPVYMGIRFIRLLKIK
jgi:hypothetical protein